MRYLWSKCVPLNAEQKLQRYNHVRRRLVAASECKWQLVRRLAGAFLQTYQPRPAGCTGVVPGPNDARGDGGDNTGSGAIFRAAGLLLSRVDPRHASLAAEQILGARGRTMRARRPGRPPAPPLAIRSLPDRQLYQRALLPPPRQPPPLPPPKPISTTPT